MIFVVDDDPEAGAAAVAALHDGGFEARFYSQAHEALERARAEEPELVLSDIVMPDLDGFALKAAYAAGFPSRTTPFIFLSSLTDPENVVRGLDLGADDYLTKPVDPRILAAKVRAILNRKKLWTIPVFRGDLQKLPFIKLLQFCELKGVTGQIEVSAGALCVTLRLTAGNLVLVGVDDTLLERLYDLTEGTFVISAHPVEFREIEATAVAGPAVPSVAPNAIAAGGPAPPPAAAQEQIMGRLSGVQVNDRLFQLQTEFVTYPAPQVVTIVFYAGRVILKRKVDVPAEKRSRPAVEAIVEELHTGTEQEVRARIAELAKKKPEEQESPQQRHARLFELGFECYREGKYREALAAWEEAYQVNPADRILETNLAVLRKKLDRS